MTRVKHESARRTYLQMICPHTRLGHGVRISLALDHEALVLVIVARVHFVLLTDLHRIGLTTFGR
jgi:hypothetical protein